MNSIRVKKTNTNINKLLIQILNYGISNVQPKNILKNFISIKNNNLVVSEKTKKVNYKNVSRIFILCVGKASVDMAETVKKILSKSSFTISKGIVIVNKENFKKIKGFKCFSSGHPVPNKNGLKASKFVESYLNKSEADDLVLIFISGGGSSLLPYPVENISLEEKISINKQLLKSGANIKEINTIRKHLSKIKGGNLIKICQPSRVHCFILSDVVGDDLSSIASGLTVPDNTEFKEAEQILKKYTLWKKISKNIREHIIRGKTDKKIETPKKNNPIFKKVKNTLIGSNSLCLQSMDDYCKKKKIPSKIWKKNIENDVEKLAEIFIRDLKTIKTSRPLLLISGGETTVNIKGKGKGGRNQEFALHLANKIKKQIPKQKFTLLSVGTDGRDGPTNAAGALIDQSSLGLIKEKKIDLTKELKNNNSYHILQKIKSLVIMKGTNTNVADVQILALL